MKHIKTLLTILLLSLGINGAVWSAELPSYYPRMLPPMIGTIEAIDIRKGVIVVNDVHWALSMNAKVRSLNTEFSSVRILKPGMKISFSTNAVNGNPQISDIWVVPANYIPSRRPIE